MANATDFLGTVYDTLAKMLNIDNVSQSMFMQMAWPGFSLSPSDFKPADAPNGPYDSDIAREAFSHVANIVPTLNRAQFENSGFEVDDLYEILISSAIPLGATPETVAVNPLNKLFSDAQYEFLQARRGSKSNPNLFYYPCTATPNNWYDEAASSFWPTINIKSTDVKPMTPQSPFVLAGGVQLANQGLLKIKPDVIKEIDLKAQIQQTIDAKAFKVNPLLGRVNLQGIDILTKPLDVNLAMASWATLGGQARGIDSNFTLTSEFFDNLSAARNKTIFSKKSTPVTIFEDPVFKANLQDIVLTQQNLDIKPTRNLNLAQQVLVKGVLDQNLVSKPVSTTDGFQISFKFCRVNIDRPWLKLALLSIRNWYMLGTAVGEYSTGSAERNPGMFPLLPISFIAIRDLTITANWSAEDKNNLDKSVSFGFFDIRNATRNQNSLTVNGLQIIAWTSKLTPTLPPQSA